MKKSTLALLTTVIAFAPLTALAQDSQTSIQTNGNSAAAHGNANLVLQNATQGNYQQQLNLDAYGVPSTPKAQTAVQDNANEAAAIGNLNVIDQNAAQTSVQEQVDVEQYLPHGYGYGY